MGYGLVDRIRVLHPQNDGDEEQACEQQQFREQPRPHAEDAGAALLILGLELLDDLDADAFGQGLAHASGTLFS